MSPGGSWLPHFATRRRVHLGHYGTAHRPPALARRHTGHRQASRHLQGKEASQETLSLRQTPGQPDCQDLLLPLQQRAVCECPSLPPVVLSGVGASTVDVGHTQWRANSGGQRPQDSLQAPVSRLSHPVLDRRAHQPQWMLQADGQRTGHHCPQVSRTKSARTERVLVDIK
ncbi:hypothetical protein TNCT_70611 [Trichonephila clavata]|uniref:Uncharacterized protein n=1 Tax=Trichonephila clavata TaxID=2740835 RepID=A0A8X6LZG9_TRICU|nr:hypothetical protein TNCT_70611 [Trichonephila clavata]